MKIEDSPYQFAGTSPVEKLRRATRPQDFAFDDLGLSFLDLLSSVVDAQAVQDLTVSDESQPVTEKEKPPTATSTQKTAETRPKLSLVKSTPEAHTDDRMTEVASDMRLLNSDLSDTDVQYLKQAVIPGLPILMGTVPFDSIFPAGENVGEISYKGFEISPKLAELIEKGYKTNSPIRVDLDPKSSLVLKFRNGQVSAEFISTDKTMAMVMQQELDDLRNRMIQKNLPVGTLEYKYQNPRQQSERQQPRDEDPEEN